MEMMKAIKVMRGGVCRDAERHLYSIPIEGEQGVSW
jgi:hypothetical protein